MEYFDKEYCIEITGSYACFTQPTLTADYVSYPVPTPFAVRNILQSIFGVKGATQWEITKIEVLKPIQFEVISLPNTTPSSLDVSLNQTKISMAEKEEKRGQNKPPHHRPQTRQI